MIKAVLSSVTCMAVNFIYPIIESGSDFRFTCILRKRYGRYGLKFAIFRFSSWSWCIDFPNFHHVHCMAPGLSDWNLEKAFSKSTCPSGIFTCLGLSYIGICQALIFSHAGAKTGMFWENSVNVMAANASAPSVTRSSLAMIWSPVYI